VLEEGKERRREEEEMSRVMGMISPFNDTLNT
jgi:hypothetical protein